MSKRGKRSEVVRDGDSRAGAGSASGARAAVAVVAHDGGPGLLRCVEALRAHSPRGTRILVADNHSRDGSIEGLEARFDGVEVLRLPVNLGFAGGANLALDHLASSRSGTAAILGLVNQDCLVCKGWLEPLACALVDPSVGVVGARLLAADGVTLEHAGGVVRANGLTDHVGRGIRSEHVYGRTAQVAYVTGAVFFLRAEVWREHRPFDEGYYPAYFEEVEFCRRLRHAGLRVLYVPESRALHCPAGGSGGPDTRVYLRRYHGSRMRFVARNLLVAGSPWAFARAELRWLLGLRDLGHLRVALSSYRRLLAELREAFSQGRLRSSHVGPA